MTALTFRHRLPGRWTDDALYRLVGQETTLTAAGLAGVALPVQLGRYRIAGVARVHYPNPSGQYTDVLVGLEQIDPQGTEPSGEEPDHAHPDRTH